MPLESVKTLVVSTEASVTHVFAQALRDYHSTRIAPVHAPVTMDPGQGVSCWVLPDTLVKVGVLDYVAPHETRPNIASLHCFYSIHVDGQLMAFGRVSFKDLLKKNAGRVVHTLQEQGLRVVMLSGDRSLHLARVAAELNIQEFASCWPHEKVAYIKRLQDEGEVVMMVGDGANDSAALAVADAGVSLDATNMSSESSDLVVLNGDLDKVLTMLVLSRRSVHLARQTVGIGMTLSVLQMIVAALGFTSPLTNAVLQEGIDLATIIHALRAIF